MTPGACPDLAVLEKLSLGRLSSVEIEAIAPHLEACPQCQTVLTALERAGAQATLQRRMKQVSGEAAPPTPSFVSGRREFAAPPPRLGQYELLDKLGQGGMGAVYKARHKALGRTVAVKILPTDRMDEAHAVDRFRREMLALARFEHPNIVRVYDAGEHEGTHYLAMEYVDGCDLATYVKRNGPATIDQAIDFILQAAHGLAAAHAEGIIHRDVKPANLLVDARGAVKILDLGLARFENAGSDGITDSDAVMGTVDYMSPEQSADTKHADASSDIYSLGCTLWYLLTGSRVYEGDTAVKRIMKHREAPVPSLSSRRNDAPWGLDQTLRKMLAKKPGERHLSMEQVIAELEQAREQRRTEQTDVSVHGDSRLTSFLKNVGSEATRPGGPSPRAATLAAPLGDVRPVTDVKPLIEPVEHTVDASRSEIETDPKLKQAPISFSGGAATKKANTLPVKWIAAGVLVAASCSGAGIYWLASGGNPGATSTATTKPAAAPVGGAKPKKVVPPPAVAPFTAAIAKQHQKAWAAYLGVPVESKNSNDMPLIVVPPGKFLMGSPSEESEFIRNGKLRTADSDRRLAASEPQHEVTLTKPLWFGKTEVTIAQFRRFADDSGFQTLAERDPNAGSIFDSDSQTRIAPGALSWRKPIGTQTDDCPVTCLTWDEAIEFCNWLSRREKLPPAYLQTMNGLAFQPDALGYRLPTEAEWEFACRAGTTARYYWGSDWDIRLTYEWVAQNRDRDRRSYSVGQKLPNPFGLYDMLGNVSEMCEDRFHPAIYTRSAVIDPIARTQGPAPDLRVIRGDPWTAEWNRSAGRQGNSESKPTGDRGFRVVRTIATGVPLNFAPQAVAKATKKADLDQPVRLTAPASPDRLVAEWIVSSGGIAMVTQGPPDALVTSTCRLKNQLPPGEFTVKEAAYSDVNAFTAEDLKNLLPAQALVALRLERVGVDDAALAECQLLPRLKRLVLASTKCTRAVVEPLGKAQELQLLTLQDVALTDDDVARLVELPKLESLSLFGSKIVTDQGVRNALKPKRLTSLSIESPKLSDEALMAVLGSSTLTSFGVSSEQITGRHLVSRKGNISAKLQGVGLYGTSIDDDAFATFRDYPQLTYVNVHHTNLSDKSIDVLISLPNLKRVEVGGSRMTRAGVNRLQAAKPDCKINIVGGLEPAVSGTAP